MRRKKAQLSYSWVSLSAIYDLMQREASWEFSCFTGNNAQYSDVLYVPPSFEPQPYMHTVRTNSIFHVEAMHFSSVPHSLRKYSNYLTRIKDRRLSKWDATNCPRVLVPWLHPFQFISQDIRSDNTGLLSSRPLFSICASILISAGGARCDRLVQRLFFFFFPLFVPKGVNVLWCTRHRHLEKWKRSMDATDIFLTGLCVRPSPTQKSDGWSGIEWGVCVRAGKGWMCCTQTAALAANQFSSFETMVVWIERWGGGSMSCNRTKHF